MMMNKYSHITNLDELEAVQKNLKKKLRKKERQVEKQIKGLRDDYSAPNLFGMTMRTAHADILLLQGIRFLKKKISSL